MNKQNKIYLFTGIALVLGAAGLWYYTSTKKDNTSPEPVKAPEPEAKKDTVIPEKKGSEPFSKTDTTKVKIQPISPLIESGADLSGKNVYASVGGAKVYSVIGTEAGKTGKDQLLGKLDKVDKMTNGTYWIYFTSPKLKKPFKIVSTVVNVEA